MNRITAVIFSAEIRTVNDAILINLSFHHYSSYFAINSFLSNQIYFSCLLDFIQKKRYIMALKICFHLIEKFEEKNCSFLLI